MLLLDSNVCVLLTPFDDVDFSGAVGNDEQLFAFCLAVGNDFSKKGFLLCSSGETKLHFQ